MDLRIPGEVSFALFGHDARRDQLAEASQKGLDDAHKMQIRILVPALFSLLEGGPKQQARGNKPRREIQAWVDKSILSFTEAWSRDYFDWLWRTLDHRDQERVRLEWLTALREKASAVLEDAFSRLPDRNGRRYRARVKARGLFFGFLYRQFPELKEQHDERQPA
jgi:CRISPR system Cascade subunit CasA